MLKRTAKTMVMGNVQLLDYCKKNNIQIAKLNTCNIEKMNDLYFFVLPKNIKNASMEHDIDSQPDVVLAMDTSDDKFKFEQTEWTSKIL